MLMDNPQERLIWLAGFIDGEGCFSLVEQNSGSKKSRHVTPRVLVSNTNVASLRYIEEILDYHELAYYVGWRDPEKKTSGFARPTGKWLWTIQIAGAKRIKRFLEVILPYMVVKEKQASTMYDWVKWVTERPRVVQNGDAEKYLERDRQVKKVISDLNKFPQRTDVEHKHNNKYVSDDMFRSAAKVAESSRND